MTVTRAVHPYDLDPALYARRTYGSRRRRLLIDASAMLNFLIIVLIVLPSRLTVPALAQVGRPALLIGLVLGTLWMLSRAHPDFVTRGPQPIRWAAILYLLSLLMSYVAGLLRGLPAIEASSAQSTIITTLAFLGVVLVATDFVPNRGRLDDVIRTVVWSGLVMALIGHIEFALHIALAEYIKIPGLVLHGDLSGLEARGIGFVRVASTATHYIEFSTVMAMILPFAIHVAIYGGTRATRVWGGIAAMFIGAAVPVALSRTGILALMVGMAAMLPAWSWRMRFNLGVLALGAIAGLMVVRPGLLGTIQSLFLNLGTDPSIKGRTDDYRVVSEYINERPVLGRGIGTFVPDLYIILDNQWLQTLIGGGVVGLLALIGIHVTAVVLGVIAVRRTNNAMDRHLCACLVSIQLIAVVAATTFDTFAFGTFLMLFGLFTGLTGAMWRLTHPNRQIRSLPTVPLS